MGIPYQAFNCKVIILNIVFVFIYLFMPNSAFAYDSLFIIEDIKVDVTAENSVIAQEKAVEQAQVQAFKILAKRMVEEAQVENVATPNSLTISSLVKDYEVTNEQLSAVRYVATYTFRFRAAAISKFFSVSGVKFTDKSSKPLLVLPIFQKEGKSFLWSEGNIWMQAWSSAHLSRGLVPVEIPIGDLMDMADIDENNALQYKRKNLDRMLARYNAKEAAIMIAVPDIDLLQSSQEKAFGDLRISIYRTDHMRAQHVRDLIITANKSETLDQLYSRAVIKADDVLQKDWKDKALSSSLQSQEFITRVLFRNIQQWEQVKQALMSIGGVSKLSVMSLKKTEAKLLFNFRGNEANLRDALLRSHLFLSQAYANGSEHKFTDNQRAEPKVIYDLTFGRKTGKVKKSNSFYQGIEPASGEVKTDVHTF